MKESTLRENHPAATMVTTIMTVQRVSRDMKESTLGKNNSAATIVSTIMTEQRV